tara:strand:- start:28 stop:318 length:291 start_codon:yes stop_codon:yes gene_type:complete
MPFNTNYDKQYWIYRSPKGDSSSHKGIPIQFLDDVKKKFPKGFRIAYRGKSKPGSKRPQQYVLKRNAETFAVYGLPKLPVSKLVKSEPKQNKKFRR